MPSRMRVYQFALASATGGATAYRYNNGFDKTQARLSGVIQQMIESDASGAR